MTNFTDDLGLDDGRPVNGRSKKARKSRGALHDLLTAKFPHLVDPQSGVCNLHKIASARGMTFQGVYKWFKKQNENRLPFNQAQWLVEQSEKFAESDAAPSGYTAMTLEDIQPYIR